MNAQPVVAGFQPQPRSRYRLWPLRGVRDAAQPPARTADELLALENVYVQDPEVGPLLVGRPGLTKLGTGGTAQLGSGSNRSGQLVCQFTKRSGTTYTVVICGGKFYTYNWSTAVFSNVVTAGNLVTATITLSATARCYAVPFADTLIISDGVNTPWSWDGQSGAGGLTSLTNCPVLYGQPVVYFAKLFGIKNTARSTIVWSEEGLPNTGYEAGGYNNAWDLVQTSTEGIVALAATDSALYVARTNSITSISGPVSTDFQTTGTREAVSSKFGTLAPAAFQVVGDRVWFLDQFGRMQVTSGGEPEEVAIGARTLLRAIPATNYVDTQMVDDPETNHVKVYLSESAHDDPNIGIWIDRDSGKYICKESGFMLTRIGQVLDADGASTILHVGGPDSMTASGSTAGYVYSHNHPNGSIWSDGLHTATAPIRHQAETGHVGFDTHVEKVWIRGEISLLTSTDMTGMQLTFVTPNGTSDSLLLDDIDTTGGNYDEADYDVDDYAVGGDEQKVTFQMRQRGRSCRLIVAHSTLGEQFAVSEMALESVAVSRRPGVK